MAAVSSTFRLCTPRMTETHFSCSPSPLSSGKVLPSYVRLPLSRLTCSSLIASEMPPRECADIGTMETQFLCSPCPLSSGKILASCVGLPVPRLTCSASVDASEIPRLKCADFWKMESAFSSLFLGFEESLDDREAGTLGVEQLVRAPWRILETGLHEDRKQGGAFSVPLIWRDASLRYANVMWFKGSYNVEIICWEDESAESIVKRFRRAVGRAGVIRECRRRRYREAPQDTIKRKQEIAAMDRRRSRSSRNANNFSRENAWTLSQEHLKPVDHSKKKKSLRKTYGRPSFDATKDSTVQKKNDFDDDYWGYMEEGEEEQAHKRSSHH